MTNLISRGSYDSEDKAAAAATWLAHRCKAEVGGVWHPYWHENLGWHAKAKLGEPYLAEMYVRSDNDDQLRFHGGFVSTPGRHGWKPGESFHGNSPLEVMMKSYLAIVGKANLLQQRLAKIEGQDLIFLELIL